MFFYILIFGHIAWACVILVPRPGIKPAPSALGDEILITGPQGNSFLFLSPSLFFFVRANFKRYNSSSPSPHCRSQVQEAGEAMKNYCFTVGTKSFLMWEECFIGPES